MFKIIWLFFLSLFGLAFLIFIIRTVIGKSTNISKRLDNVHGHHKADEKDESKSFGERLLKPVYDRISNFFSRFTPGNIQDEYNILLSDAGLARSYTPARLVTNQVLFAIIIGGASSFLMVRFFGGINLNVFAVLIIGSFYLPILYLRKMSNDRKDRIQRDLPNLLDMIYISVEAGLSFDSAMTTTASKTDGELSNEIIRAMEEINRGRHREEALFSIADRTGVADVRSFIATVVMSEKLGSNISNVLRIQADVIRDKRKQRAEETINKMPIKMLLPLVFLLLPALFVVIMGPSIVNIMNTPF